MVTGERPQGVQGPALGGKSVRYSSPGANGNRRPSVTS